jgi:segregation and condensation protein A
MDYQVNLDDFHGPMDLLLYLVKRNELDVRDIPIAQVAEQFSQYLGVLGAIDVEKAGDFLVMAATLMEIKSRMLLPQSEAAATAEEDPRLNLVRQLLEYRRFKEAAALLDVRAQQQSQRLARHPPPTAVETDPARQPLQPVELWDLVSAFGRIMQETLAQEPEPIVTDQTPLHIYTAAILEQLERAGRLPFSSLFTPPRYRSRLIGLFLAVLELIKAGRIRVEQEQEFGDICVSLAETPGVE